MPTKGPWGNAASHLKTLHAEEASLNHAKQLALEEIAAANKVVTQKTQSKVWAGEKADARHRRISYEKDLSGNTVSDNACSGNCVANEGADGWWHSGCGTHCFCLSCKKVNSKWMGL
jgi:hypothetical protein